MKVGVLYPSSKAWPDADLDFVNGIRAALRAKNAESAISLQLESVGIAGSEKEVYSKAEKLLRMDSVDLVVAFIDLKITPILEPLFYAADKLLIVVNPGANYPHNWMAQPNVIYLSLEHAFLNWMSGALAAKSGKAAVATTFYDCGYLHSAAMSRRFMECGGQLVHNYVNNQPYDEGFEIGALTDFLRAQPDVRSLLCTFDTTPAALFYQRLAQTAGLGKLRLFASPMMLEKAALARLPETGSIEIHGFRPWSELVSGEAGKAFNDAFHAQASKEPGLFALLGWELGQVLISISSSDTSKDAEAALAGLLAAPIDSPRGPLALDPKTNHYVAPIVQCHWENGQLHETPLQLDALEAAWRGFSAIETEGVTSGWTNTYLCY